MGSNQGKQRLRAGHIWSLWRLPIITCAAALLVAALGDTGRELFSFFRPAIIQGEVWRLFSAHFTHLGMSHLVLNLVAMLLIWYLVSSCLTQRQWLIVVLLTIVGIDLGLWFLQPGLLWYVGLSGLLHGLLAAGVTGGLKSGRIEIWILGIALIAKLVYEQLFGPLPGSEAATGGMVIVASHAYGALAGAVAAAILIRVRAATSI